MGTQHMDAGSQRSASLQPIQLFLKVQILENIVSSMFTTVSDLKHAYMQLQSAHMPYHPHRLKVADKAVINELKKISELKHYYKEALAILDAHEVEDESFARLPRLDVKNKVLEACEKIIGNFHSEIQKKNAAVECVKDILASTTLKEAKLERRVKRLEQKLGRNAAGNAFASATPQLLESAVLVASEATRSFTKLLTFLMKSAEWDLDAAANSIEPDIVYVKKTHSKFAFESYVSQRMLNGFDSETFDLSIGEEPTRKSKLEFFDQFQELRTADPAMVVSAKPDRLFGKYCLKKFLDVVHPKMEESFFGNSEHRKQILDGKHPHSQLYQSFLKLAKAVWLLHSLAFSFEPTARTFQVKKDTEFSPLYMESIVQMAEFDVNSVGAEPGRVGFTIMPGFRVHNTIIKCQVYIVGSTRSNAEAV